MSVTERLGELLVSRTSRRSFLARSTLTATALSVAPVDFLLRPGTAYAQICECAPGYDCDCSALCCDGYTQFCCTINNGINACPPGTFAGGWWQAEGSIYCTGTRYYIDCMGTCQTCGCNGGNFCPGCDGQTCECALGNCNNRHVGCTEFRYGQCNEQISCSGVIACRVVSCTPPWVLDPSCSTVAATDDSTANHYAPCQDGPTSYPADVVGMAATASDQGYWLVDAAGRIRTFGDAVSYGDCASITLSAPIVGIAATPTGKGYWLVGSDGGIFAFGDAGFDGSTGNLKLNRPIVGMSGNGMTASSSTTSGSQQGYRFVGADGGVFDFDMPFYGSTGDLKLNKPVVGMAVTPGGDGYWLVAADGGIFRFGDAGFYGSTGDLRLNQPVVGMAAGPGGKGYWLVAADGGIFCFGETSFYGSTGDLRLAQPIVGMAATSDWKGYWLVAADGGIFCFGNAGFYGSGAG